ncbi:hypothetical protein [Alkalihalobacillus deserti]|uniref:hypothetical protein n=1 Tax=Alkalihalobacillus deserti TaxID=2879466 RepID=UPI001D153701|nr:hypothetical protein [Alkalihalobacillus deserti]
MKENHPTYSDIQNVHQQLSDMKFEHWFHDNLFPFQWWLLVITLVLPWFIWWKFVDKKRINNILLFGSLLMLLVMMMDDIGVEMHLWSYPYNA